MKVRVKNKSSRNMGPYQVTSFYLFQQLTLERVAEISTALEQLAESHSLRGLCVLGTEGINATISGLPKDCIALKTLVNSLFDTQNIVYKNSHIEKHAFKRFKVDLRDEIVTIGCTLPHPDSKSPSHVTPDAWHQMLQDKNCVVLDTRNHYETQLGKFKGAINPGLNTFAEFPNYIKHCGIPTDKTVLMYCTGGIRCEKASLAMKAGGYEKVFQLEGGILRYLEQYPNQAFEGECFVFDKRVAVDQELNPSTRYKLCPHCGDPGDIPTDCAQCGKRAVICSRCERFESYRSCSKNCRYHLELREQRKQHEQDQPTS